MSVKIILVDDHAIVREGLRGLLDRQPGIKIVGEAEDGLNAIALVNQLNPDVVVMDITMPDMNGIEATKRIVEQHPDVKVIALSMHSDKRFVTSMLGAGASGYLRKNCASDELTLAIHTVMDNHIYISPKIGTIKAKDWVNLRGVIETGDANPLTDREREVLQRIAEGQSSKEISERLYLSIKTVEKHRENIMGKLNLHTVAELTKYALREGLTSLED